MNQLLSFCELLFLITFHSDYIAASFFIGAYLMFSVMYRGVVHFPVEKEVVKKERQSGAYRLSAYYLSKIVAEFPVKNRIPHYVI